MIALLSTGPRSASVQEHRREVDTIQSQVSELRATVIAMQTDVTRHAAQARSCAHTHVCVDAQVCTQAYMSVCESACMCLRFL